jgi:hypothetical protein
MKKNIKVIHGKKTSEFTPQTLDQVWGNQGIELYGTLNEEKYELELDQMQKGDLFYHSISHDIKPVGDRNRLKTKLLAKFRKHVEKFKPHNLETDSFEDKKISKAARAILAEGR